MTDCHPSAMDRRIPFDSRCILTTARQVVYGGKTMTAVDVLRRYRGQNIQDRPRIDAAIKHFEELKQ